MGNAANTQQTAQNPPPVNEPPDDDSDATIPGEEPVDTDPAKPPSGQTTTAPGVLAGGVLTRVERAGAEDLWMMAYEWPAGSGRFVAWQFDNEAQVVAALGPQWWTTTAFQNRSESWLNSQVNVLSSADEVIGVAGTFSRLMQDSMRQAAVTAGLNDPTLQGLIAN